MEHVVYAILLTLFAIGVVWVWRKERGAVSRAERFARERDTMQVETRRMFNFLHGLGTKLYDDYSPANMHRYIVDGVADVVEADAGMLYLLDSGTDRLVVVYQSPMTSPVLPLPSEILALEDAEEAAREYRSYLRLSAIKVGEGFIGKLVQEKGPTLVPDLSAHEAFPGGALAPQYHAGVSMLAVPLVYARGTVGLLIVTRSGGRPFNRNDEEMFESIAEQSSFALGSAIVHAEAAEKRRLERELTQASEIQRVLLPKTAPELLDYEIAAEYKAARHVSGDYYDYVRVDEDRFGIAIGDVCGKGIAASLVMAMCRSNLRSRAPENLSPASVLHSVNRSIFPDIREDMFVSLLYLILERGSTEITLARAGHEPPILYRKAKGTVKIIETTGLVAGIDEGPVFKRAVKDYRFRVASGDILLLYTDGLIECENKSGEEYGLERLCELLIKHSEASSQAIIDAIVADVAAFCDSAAQTDDITLIAIKKR